MNYIVGIDGSGTGCRAVVCERSGQHLGTGSADANAFLGLA
jgi:N-acetylglucosamine kinase-like BadF-type ATPase